MGGGQYDLTSSLLPCIIGLDDPALVRQAASNAVGPLVLGVRLPHHPPTEK